MRERSLGLISKGFYKSVWGWDARGNGWMDLSVWDMEALVLDRYAGREARR